MDFSLLGFSGLNKVFNLHPLFVHFPLALIPASLLFYCLGTVLKKESLLVAGRGCLYFALLGAMAAVWTGLRAMETFPHNETIHHMAQTHKIFGLWVFGALVVLTLWSFRIKDQRPVWIWGFLILLAATTLFVSQGGDIGARMVYVQGAAVKPAVSVIAPPDEIEEFERRQRGEAVEEDEESEGSHEPDHHHH